MNRNFGRSRDTGIGSSAGIATSPWIGHRDADRTRPISRGTRAGEVRIAAPAVRRKPGVTSAALAGIGSP
jgi:hypothetical protein